MHRIKQILTITMAVMMAVVFMPVLPGVDGAARAATGTNVAKIVETGVEYETVQAAITDAANEQTVQMIANSTENVVIGKAVDPVKTFTLDLNGHTLTGGGNAPVIENFKGNLTLKDSGTGGKITGGDGKAMKLIRSGGGVYNTGSSTINMEGGTISGNNVNGVGGGVYNVGELNITGGTITGNSAKLHGGGVHNEGTITVSGTAKITGNMSGTGEDAKASNVYLPNGKFIFIGTAGLSAEATFGVTTEKTPSTGSPIAVTGSNNADYSKYFTSDDDSYSIHNKIAETSQQVMLGDVAAQIVETGEAYDKVQNAIIQAAEKQTVKLLRNSNENITVATGKNITLDLNGHVLKGTGDGSVVEVETATLKIMDSGNDTHCFMVSDSGLWELQSGTQQSTYSFDSINGLMKAGVTSADIPGKDSIIAVKGGCITSGTGKLVSSKYDGGGIHTSSGSHIVLEGGNVIGNKSDYGGGIAAGDFTISGGAVCGNTSNKNGGGLFGGNGCNLVVEGGMIAYNTAKEDGGGIWSYTNTVMKKVIETSTGGKVYGNKANRGGGIYNTYSTTLNDGVISNNEANYGGGVFNEHELVVKGTTTIKDNTATEEGGGVYNSEGFPPRGIPGADFTMTGGTITGNKAKTAGGLGTGNTVTVSGTANVTNNTLFDGSTANNLYIQNGKTVTVGTGTMSIGVTTQTAPTTEQPVNITGTNNTDFSKCFTSDNSSYYVKNNGSESNQIVKLFVHAHSWTYALSKTNSDNDTITATCGGDGTCSYAGKDKSITISASGATYDGNAHGASLSGTSLAGQTSLPTIMYAKKKSSGGYDTASATAPTSAGVYKASITVGSGDKAVTAYDEYAINVRPLEISGTTASNKIYDGKTDAKATVGKVKGILENDDVSVKIESAAFGDVNVGTDKDVQIAYKLEGKNAGNYDVPSDDTTKADITAKAITVTADNKSMKLGEAVPKFTATVNGLVGTDTVEYSFNGITPETQGVYSIIPKGNAKQGNYEVTYAQGVLTVSEAGSNAKADPKDLAKVLEKYRGEEEYQSKILDVEVRTDGEVPQADKALVEQKIGSNKKVIYNDTDLYLIIKDGGKKDEKNIGDENDTLIGVAYKFDFAKKKNIQVLRVHKGAVEELTTAGNEKGEYVEYDKASGTITVHAMKYSTFAFAYDTASGDGGKGHKSGTKTGDSTNLMTCIILIVLALIVGTVTISYRRKGQ